MINIELTQVEVNFIRALLEKEPLVQVAIEDGLTTGECYTRRTLVALLDKFPYRKTTTAEREEAYKAVDVEPLDTFTRKIVNLTW